MTTIRNRRKHGFNSHGGYYKHPFTTKKTSIFALRTYQHDINDANGVTKWTSLKSYCLKNFVSYKQVKYFARKKWIAITSYKNRIYVCELCPDLIKYHLDFCVS